MNVRAMSCRFAARRLTLVGGTVAFAPWMAGMLLPAPGDRRFLLAPPSSGGPLGVRLACCQGDGLRGFGGSYMEGAYGRVVGEDDLLLAWPATCSAVAWYWTSIPRRVRRLRIVQHQSEPGGRDTGN